MAEKTPLREWAEKWLGRVAIIDHLVRLWPVIATLGAVVLAQVGGFLVNLWHTPLNSIYLSMLLEGAAGGIIVYVVFFAPRRTKEKPIDQKALIAAIKEVADNKAFPVPASTERQVIDTRPEWEEAQVTEAIGRLLIDKAETGLGVPTKSRSYPVEYQLLIRNTRPLILDLAGYTVHILFDDIVVHTVSWDEGAVRTSTGCEFGPVWHIPGDTAITLGIPVGVRQMGSLPDSSPTWAVTGELRFANQKGEVLRRSFDLNTKKERLPDKTWLEIRKEWLWNQVDGPTP